MLQPEYTNKFKKDLKIVQSRNWDIEMLKDVIRSLCEEQPLPHKNKEHFLSGNWCGYKECHIQPD